MLAPRGRAGATLRNEYSLETPNAFSHADDLQATTSQSSHPPLPKLVVDNAVNLIYHALRESNDREKVVSLLTSPEGTYGKVIRPIKLGAFFRNPWREYMHHQREQVMNLGLVGALLTTVYATGAFISLEANEVELSGSVTRESMRRAYVYFAIIGAGASIFLTLSSVL